MYVSCHFLFTLHSRLISSEKIVTKSVSQKISGNNLKVPRDYYSPVRWFLILQMLVQLHRKAKDLTGGTNKPIC